MTRIADLERNSNSLDERYNLSKTLEAAKHESLEWKRKYEVALSKQKAGEKQASLEVANLKARSSAAEARLTAACEQTLSAQEEASEWKRKYDVAVKETKSALEKAAAVQDHASKQTQIVKTCKAVTVRIKLNDSSLDNSFRRKSRGGVVQVQYNALFDLVDSVTLVPSSDRWVWSLEGSGEFSVASIRKMIDEKRLSTVDTKTRWIKCVPIKVNILAWKIKIDALPTRFKISRRGIDIDSILCPICDCGVESASHLFFSCSLVRQVVRKVCSWWEVNYVDVNSYVEWVTWMESLRLMSKSKLMLEGVFYVVWWHIWLYRNKLLFETKFPSNAVIFEDVEAEIKDKARKIEQAEQRVTTLNMELKLRFSK
ncbi:RNA-directed DNA polymerase, eukaryota [Tanacetum coccineum]